MPILYYTLKENLNRQKTDKYRKILLKSGITFFFINRYTNLVTLFLGLFQEKSLRNLKPRTLFPVTFCFRTSENEDFFT